MEVFLENRCKVKRSMSCVCMVVDKCAQRVENKLNKYHLLPSAMQNQSHVLTMPPQVVHSIFFSKNKYIYVQC